MFPYPHHVPRNVDRALRPDRRPAVSANEILLRVKRTTTRTEV